MDTIKDRNDMDITEAYILRRGGKNTQKNYTKTSSWPIFPQWCNHPPWARHPEMWNEVLLRKHHMSKTSGGDGIPAELFQKLKYDSVNVLLSICQKIWKTQHWTQD